MGNIEDNSILLEREAEHQNSKIKRYKRQNRALAVVLAVAFIIICAFVLLGMFAENVYLYTGVEGPSMKPTINADASESELDEAYDYAYVNTYQQGTYGDIIVVSHTDNTGQTKYVIKRLFGLAGDTITFDNRESGVTRVYRNGELLTEHYLDMDANSKFMGLINQGLNSRFGITEITVPQGYIFYMGDNRNNSEDCRSYTYTEVPYCEKVENIIGRVDYIIPHEDVAEGDGKDVERFFNGIKEIFASIF